ncbi:MAG: type I polyketide synthase, partial [Deltaproteobacteria bacterium]|nr:type I polyketide synthase [Deltaproteobacteria bacterium]
MSQSKKSSCPIAIIGLGAVMPDAADAPTFWKNICAGLDSVGEVPTHRWDPALHYDSDPKTPNRSYTKIGAFISDYKFNPLQFRIPPRVAESMDDVQKWAVEASSEALRDSGYEQKDFDRERCAVIIGNALAGEFHYMSTLRVYLPKFAQALRDTEQYRALAPEVQKALDAQFEQTAGLDLPEINEDTMPGELSNVIAGRVAQILNLRGSNYTTDAACASSLAALQSAAAGLAEMRFDMVLTGGVDSSLGPPSFVKFSKIGALSANLSCPFDERADGFVMGEGCGIMLLKRLEDAERDGDKIYAVLRGIGSSSDGKGKGITAPNPHGQRLAIQRAYEAAGISPTEVGMIEAHGTSTAVGDVVEANTTAEFFSSAGVRPQQIPMGSVKSQIGHMKGAAGAAALLKAALCIHHKIIPATLHFEKPNPKIDFEHAPFYIPTRLQGWESKGPRIAGVSSFGFGGSNFHAVLSEHQAIRAEAGPGTGQGPREKSKTGGIMSLGAEDADGLRQLLDDGAPLPGTTSNAPHRLSIAYENESQLNRRLRLARTAIDKDEPTTWKALSAQGIHRGQGPAGKTAFMFPGQGSQYINMLKTLKEEEPVVAETFAEADRIMAPILGRSLSEAIFTLDSPEARKALQDTTICQPAMLTADLAIARLLEQKGIHPDMVTGHSLGEYAALVAASVLSLEDALLAVSARAKEMVGVRVDDPGKMAAVFMPADELIRRIQNIEGVVPANFNSSNQTVLAGASAPMDAAVARLTAAGVKAVMLDVSHAFHSPIVALAKEPLRRVLEGFNFSSPRIPVLANLDALPYDTDPQARAARFFVEVGPKKILTHFVNDILDDPTVIAVHTNHPKQNDQDCIQSCLAAAFAAGQNLGAEKSFQPISAQASNASHQPASRIGSFGKESTRAAAERPSGREHRPEEADAVQTSRGAMPPRGQQPKAVISGVSLGLPGLDRDLFAEDNTERILAGYAGIDPVGEGTRQDLAKQHVVRLFKDAPGGPAFGVIEDPEQVAQLA